VGKVVATHATKTGQKTFVTTKTWRKYHGYDETLKNLNMSLKRLDMPSVDLWLIHWPGPAYSTMHRKKVMIEEHGIDFYFKDGHGRDEMPALRGETWRAMEDAYKQGKAKAIGVSNFTVEHLKQLKKTAEIMPMVNQVEMHPYYNQKELREYCAAEGIVVQAYASLGGQDAGKKVLEPLGGPLMENITVITIAEGHGVSTAQAHKPYPLSPSPMRNPQSDVN